MSQLTVYTLQLTPTSHPCLLFRRNIAKASVYFESAVYSEHESNNINVINRAD